MKNKIVFSILVTALSLQVSCQTASAKLKDESLSITYLLYNMESNKFPVSPPPPKEGVPTNRPEKSYTSDKYIKSTKYVILISKDDSIDYQKEIDLPKDFKNILENPGKVFKSRELLKSDMMDLDGNNVPIIDSKKNLKIQQIALQKGLLGVLFLSDFRFNENLNKAVLQFGAYTHELSGYTAILCLEKKNGNWVLVRSKQQSES